MHKVQVHVVFLTLCIAIAPVLASRLLHLIRPSGRGSFQFPFEEKEQTLLSLFEESEQRVQKNNRFFQKWTPSNMN